MFNNKRRAERYRIFFRTRIGMLLILAGICLALSPFLVSTYKRLFPPPPVSDEIKEILTAEHEEMPLVQPGESEGIEARSSELNKPETEEYPEKFVPEGVSVLYIPSLDVMTDLNYGVELEDLRKIPGIYPQSGYPDTGNVSIAAHRDAWFRDLDKLEPGDEIKLYYNGKVYIYSVDEVFITHSRDWSVIDPTSEPALTLTTCHPPGLGAAPYRLIARAYLKETIMAITQ